MVSLRRLLASRVGLYFTVHSSGILVVCESAKGERERESAQVLRNRSSGGILFRFFLVVAAEQSTQILRASVTHFRSKTFALKCFGRLSF